MLNSANFCWFTGAQWGKFQLSDQALWNQNATSKAQGGSGTYGSWISLAKQTLKGGSQGWEVKGQSWRLGILLGPLPWNWSVHSVLGRSSSITLILLAARTRYQAEHKTVAILSDLCTQFVYTDTGGGQEAGSDGSGLVSASINLPSRWNTNPSQVVKPVPTLSRRKQLLCLSFHFSLSSSLSFLSFLNPG